MVLRFLVMVALCSSVLLARTEQAHAYTINTTETGKRIRWGSDHVALRLQPSFERFLARDGARKSIEMALDAWRGLPRVPDLVLQPDAPSKKPGHTKGSPSNGVYLLEHWPYEPEKLAITVVTYEMETGRLLDADILVNGDTKFALLDEHGLPDTKHYDLAAVLTHELGHLLGLGESSEAPDATMFPYAAPGETQKRTLADDDEDGVIESYLSSPPKPAGGCGPMTVAGRGMSPTWLAAWACVFACVVLRGRKRGARAGLALLAAAGILLVLGFDAPPSAAVSTQSDLLRALDDVGSPDAHARLREAIQQSDPELRLQATEVLARAGVRSDRALAESLTSDADPRIAARAHTALQLLLARAPREVIEARHGDARERLRMLRGNAKELTHGRARWVGTVVGEGGVLFTEYAVQPRSGAAALRLRVMGGQRDGIGQRVLDGELPPQDGQEIVMAEQPDGTQRWAFATDGRVFGGYAGDGPAIVGAL